MAFTMKLASGIELLTATEGTGRPAARGDQVYFHLRLYLNRGDEVPINAQQPGRNLPAGMICEAEDQRCVEHRIELGRRQVIAGVEQSLEGMRAGGHRRVRISPHLAYRDRGIPGLVPPDAVLIADIRLNRIEACLSR